MRVALFTLFSAAHKMATKKWEKYGKIVQTFIDWRANFPFQEKIQFCAAKSERHRMTHLSSDNNGPRCNDLTHVWRTQMSSGTREEKFIISICPVTSLG
jgi:hypothetical protein